MFCFDDSTTFPLHSFVQLEQQRESSTPNARRSAHAAATSNGATVVDGGSQ